MRKTAARSSAVAPSAPCSISSISGRNAGSSSSARLGVVSRLWLPISVMISATRGIHMASIDRIGSSAAAVGKPHAVGALPGLLQRQLEGIGGQPHVAGEFAQHLRRGRRRVADQLGHAGRKPVGEFELGQGADGRLGGHVDGVAGLAHRVVDLDVAIDEDAVPGHQHVVEDAEGILLVEARRQRLVERIGARRRGRSRGTGISGPVCRGEWRKPRAYCVASAGMGWPG